MLKHYVEIQYPGIFVDETEVREVKKRDPEQFVRELPKNAFGFRYFDRVEKTEDGEVLKGKPKNHSGQYYIGKVYTLAEVERLFPQHDILISNMKCNGWGRAVQCRTGNWKPLLEKDIVITEDPA